MRRWRFRSTVAVSFLAAALVVLGAAYFGFRHELEQALVHREHRPLLRRARRIAKRYDAGDPRLAPRSSLSSRGVAHALFRLDGRAISETPPGPSEVEVPRRFVEKAAARPGQSTTETLAARDGTLVRALAASFTPVDGTSPERDSVVVVTMRSLASIEATADDEMAEALRIATPLVVLIALCTAWFVARRVARPLERMAEQASRASLTDGDVPVSGSGAGDEFDALARVLNATFARLRAVHERQSRFTSAAAHELRTPVAAILGRADVVLRRERDSDEYRRALGDIRDVAEGAARTVESLLRLARTDARDGLAAVHIDVGRLVEHEAHAVRERFGVSDDALHVASVETGCELIGDPTLLGILVRNLLENAVTHGRSERAVDVSVRRDGDDIVLVVRDHGPGIPREHLDRVFDPLHRVDAARSRRLGGAGLGLALARAITAAHNGTLTVESPAGSGATFVARLRALPGTAATNTLERN